MRQGRRERDVVTEVCVFVGRECFRCGWNGDLEYFDVRVVAGCEDEGLAVKRELRSNEIG
jgi:hypothetical protein